MGEGSFVGHYGDLPKVAPEESDAGIAASIQQSTKRRMTITPSPTLVRKSDSGKVIEVKADVEPVFGERLGLTKSATLDNYSVSIDLGPQEQVISFANRDVDTSSPLHASVDVSVSPPDAVPVADATTPRRISKPQIQRQSQVHSKLPDAWLDRSSCGVNFSLLGDEVVTEDGKM